MKCCTLESKKQPWLLLFLWLHTSFESWVVAFGVVRHAGTMIDGVASNKNNKHRGGGSLMAASNDASDAADYGSTKRIVLIRHGQTYMNELIGGGGISYGQPGFTDVFEESKADKFKDSPLSKTGIEQALKLKQELHFLRNGEYKGLSKSIEEKQMTTSYTNDLDLVVVSPLSRALQTMEMVLYEHIREIEKDIPIIALPQAAERVYLISDHGKPRSELKKRYSFVDFDVGFHPALGDDDPWHFIPTQEMEENYLEWRPHGEGQVYACLGEHQDAFDRRMSELYHWLQSREEQCIAVVCHAGVIEWMTSGEIFANCELRVMNFKDLQPRKLLDLEFIQQL
jgi:broad specificity phosphatase PhoE